MLMSENNNNNNNNRHLQCAISILSDVQGAETVAQCFYYRDLWAMILCHELYLCTVVFFYWHGNSLNGIGHVQVQVIGHYLYH